MSKIQSEIDRDIQPSHRILTHNLVHMNLQLSPPFFRIPSWRRCFVMWWHGLASSDCLQPCGGLGLEPDPRNGESHSGGLSIAVYIGTGRRRATHQPGVSSLPLGRTRLQITFMGHVRRGEKHVGLQTILGNTFSGAILLRNLSLKTYFQ